MSGRFVIAIEIAFSFCQEMNRTGGAIFAIDIGIPAFEARFAHVDIMFEADIGRFPVGMVCAASQCRILSCRKYCARWAEVRSAGIFKSPQEENVFNFL